MSSGKLVQGQKYDPKDGFTVPFSQQMHESEVAAAMQGNAATEIIPQDAAASLVRIYGPPDGWETEVLELFDTVSFQLPDVLQSINITYNYAHGNGGKDSSVDCYSEGMAGGLNMSPSNTCQASASIVPDATIGIAQVWAQNVPARKLIFYMQGDITQAALLARLDAITGTTVNLWPAFKPEPITLSLQGQSKSIQQTAESSHMDRWSLEGIGSLSWNIEVGDGYSVETSTTTKTMQIPPTIHGEITVTGEGGGIDLGSYTPTVDEVAEIAAGTLCIVGITTTVDASLDGITGAGGAPSFPAVPNTPTPITAVVRGRAKPGTIPATTPSAIPTSGLYLFKTDAQKWHDDINVVQVVLVDFSYFA